jgi:mannosyltransferase OCH1-like enzyme
MSGIPRVFHSIWVGDPMPDHLREYVASWTRVHPSWVHRVWGDGDIDWLQNQDLYDFAEAITRDHGQFRSDVARYEILHRYGGVYVDCDFEALQPIDELVMGVECFAAWETDDVWINNAILGAEPGHPLFADLIDGLSANVKTHRGKRPNILSGPQYLTPAMRDRDDVTLFPAEQFYPFRWDELERRGEHFPKAYAVHHWNRKTTLAHG